MNFYIITIILSGYLIYSSYRDIKTYTVSIHVSATVVIIIFAVNLIYGSNSMLSILLSTVPGLFLFIMAYITRQSIGYGDCLVFMVVGLGMGFKAVLMVLLISFILSSLFSLYLIARHKSGKTAIPFVPFILCSYMLTMFINF